MKKQMFHCEMILKLIINYELLQKLFLKKNGMQNGLVVATLLLKKLQECIAFEKKTGNK